MSSEQFSGKPLPAAKKACLECGAIAPSRAAVACWMCGARFATQEESAPSSTAIAAGEPPTTRTPSPDRDRGSWEGVAWSVMGLIGLFVFCVVGYEAPGFLMCLGPLAAGVIFQLLVRTNQDPQSPAGALHGCVLFLATIGVVGFFGFVAVVVALQIVCSRPMVHLPK